MAEMGILQQVEVDGDRLALEAVIAVCGLPAGADRAALVRELAGVLERINNPMVPATAERYADIADFIHNKTFIVNPAPDAPRNTFGGMG